MRFRPRTPLALASALALATLTPTVATAAPPSEGAQGQEPSVTRSEGLAPTPPMGWNSWNNFGCEVSAKLVRQTAEAMVSSGMKAAGYDYVNIDDCWMAERRGPGGRLVPDPDKFPNGMKTLADHVHSLGLEIGIYATAGTETCAGYPGSLGHERIDARTFAEWGIDYLKYDNCNNRGIPAEERYRAMAEAIETTGEPIVLSICEWGQNAPWKGWGREVGGQLWRTTGDIRDTWTSWTGILDEQVGLTKYSGPNGWNDPDMLEVGNGNMSTAEYRAHFAMWALLNAPLIAGNDLRDMDEPTRRILTDEDLIAVNQDWAGVQGRKIRDDGDQEVWAKPMSDGSVAVALFNRARTNTTISVPAERLGLPPASHYRLRDLWHDTESTSTGTVRGAVGAHSAVVLRVWPRQGERLAPAHSLNLRAPEHVESGEPFTVTTTLHNDGRRPLHEVRLRLRVPVGYTVESGNSAHNRLVRGGGSWQREWTLRPTGTRHAPDSRTLEVAADANSRTGDDTHTATAEQEVTLVSAPASGGIEVSSMPLLSAENGMGPVERDRANGYGERGDGATMSIAGTEYATGLGVHADSVVRLYLGGECERFSAQVGVDDQYDGEGSVEFTVRGDGRTLAETGHREGGQPAVPIDVGVTDTTVLQLRVSDAGDGDYGDAADWAKAQLRC
ncbi:alpha-galactosidase [Actinopolyspora erythraea]|uniref:Alpha-galactosidase n=1 Tax=Actinopolyspora erythraea TaxID=414996 RepID=A0A099D716_9ACTN|nr:NPCBM/NEW2 domain-containing protein [Actinopolyspora erythraea]ASU79030.1 alpha-galactosidase [Actinopolyspora erythraea]KGI81160.1 alpha-galactosidase [Actinopolyspora erythraea]